jgi:hypothetical protein
MVLGDLLGRARPGADLPGVIVDAPAAVPTPDVLPSGVRRRLAAHAVLAGVLAGEFLSGMVIGLAWESRDDLGRMWVPDAVMATGDQGSGPAASTDAATATSAMTTSVVVVPPPPTPPPPPPPAMRTEPRNPFAVQIQAP